MHFLLTNDDGIYATGLSSLKKELSKEAECLIVAPEREQSAVGHAITLSRPLMVRKFRKNGKFFGYAVAGTPADCVKIGIKELTDKPIDLVVSGINLGPNVGIDVIYSGTVSAATEAAILGVSSLAISLDTRSDDADFSFAAKFARKLVLFMLRHSSLLKGTPLNVNIPAVPKDQIKGVAVTRQGSAQMMETFERRVDPRENIYYWLVAESLTNTEGMTDSDTTALKNGMITITPLHYDLTHYDVMADLHETMKELTF
ncbi:MAG: 5'/3'-nucleotidase SurE [Deltaproteobacteria bacterium]|nr:5'/3'-nucleotidase SurE [Deltaproteobacteria bacterium]